MVFQIGVAKVFQIGVSKIFQDGVANVFESGVCKDISDWYLQRCSYFGKHLKLKSENLNWFSENSEYSNLKKCLKLKSKNHLKLNS